METCTRPFPLTRHENERLCARTLCKRFSLEFRLARPANLLICFRSSLHVLRFQFVHFKVEANDENSIQFICIAHFHKLQICLGVLYNLYT